MKGLPQSGVLDLLEEYGYGSKSRTLSEHPNPHYRLKWVVHLPQNGTIGFDPQPYVFCFFIGEPSK